MVIAVLLLLFFALGGFHGYGGYIFAFATAPIGVLSLLGVGDGRVATFSAYLLELLWIVGLASGIRMIRKRFK
jgi:hypothetical protein